MSYKIVIFKTELVKKETTEWLELHDKTEYDTKKDPKYGYITEVLPYEEETKIYEQVSEKEIDLKTVIDSFNL